MVTCVVSIDYMTNPRAVMEEVCRVLKPGGRAIMSISNRCFPTKAVAIWLQTNVRSALRLFLSALPLAFSLASGPCQGVVLFVLPRKKASGLTRTPNQSPLLRRTWSTCLWWGLFFTTQGASSRPSRWT